MKCPYCDRKIRYPTEKQLLAWFYCTVWGMSQVEAAKQMGISPPSLNSLLSGLKAVWPNLMTKTVRPHSITPFIEKESSIPLRKF